MSDVGRGAEPYTLTESVHVWPMRPLAISKSVAGTVELSVWLPGELGLGEDGARGRLARGFGAEGGSEEGVLGGGAEGPAA